MTAGILILAASAGDGMSLSALHAASFADTWGAASFATLLERPQVLGLKALVNDKHIAGFILTQVIAEEAEILTICVDPALRRNGVGRLLLTQACRQLEARGAQSLFLEVSEDNEGARALYDQSGFVAVGRRKAYYRDNAAAPGARDALVMRRQLGA